MKKWTSIIMALAALLIICMYYAPHLDSELQLFGAKPHHWVHKINVFGTLGMFIALFAVSLVLTYRTFTKK